MSIYKGDQKVLQDVLDLTNLQPELDKKANATDLTAHTTAQVNSETGVHGFRQFNNELQYFNGTNWITIETGSNDPGFPPKDVINPNLKSGNETIIISWEDPEDTIVEGITLSKWKGTKLVQKIGAYPENEKDGTQVVDNQVRNQYKENGFKITGLTNGTTYYFALFPYSDTGAVNTNEINRLSGIPEKKHITMTAKIDLSNSNPETSVTYADDAIDMVPGDTAWDEFFGHYPVLFKDGVEIGKLNPNDFTKFEDGTDADIVSGNVGDVMIAFPRRGIKISTSGDILTVSMTKDSTLDQTYYAHTRGTISKDVFYLGAYKGFVENDKLRSLSGKVPTANKTIGEFRTHAHNTGSGYEQSGFYQLLFRQVMYILKYKNLNSQTALGMGYVGGDAVVNTGATNTKGMDYGSTSQTIQMKLFGLEDFWGNIWEWIDGLYFNSSRNTLTATNSFNDEGEGYTDQGQYATADIYGYISKIQGTSETGFIPTETNGSATTYFSDETQIRASKLPQFGGSQAQKLDAGVFQLYAGDSASYMNPAVAARLMFL